VPQWQRVSAFLLMLMIRAAMLLLLPATRCRDHAMAPMLTRYGYYARVATIRASFRLPALCYARQRRAMAAAARRVAA